MAKVLAAPRGRSATDDRRPAQREATAQSDGPRWRCRSPAPNVPFSGAITRTASVAFGKASLDDMRHIKSTFGTTVNDVVLAACTQTLRSVPDRARRPARRAAGVQRAGVGARQDEHEGTNQVSTMFVRLPVQLEDPVEQLRTINADTREAKEMQNAIGADMLQDFAQFMPADAVQPRHAPRTRASTSPTGTVRCTTSSCRTSPARRSRSTAPAHSVVGVYPFGPLLEGAGLNITVLSNMGNVDFGVIACRETRPRRLGHRRRLR